MLEQLLEIKVQLLHDGIPSPDIAMLAFNDRLLAEDLLADKTEWLLQDLPFEGEFRLIAGRVGELVVWVLPDVNAFHPGDDVFLIRLAAVCGAKQFVLLTQSVSVNPSLQSAVLLVKDQLHLSGKNPLRGKNEDALGPRFPDMSVPFDMEMLTEAMELLHQHKIPFQQGVYAEVTESELQDQQRFEYFRFIGADHIGLSMARHVIAIRHMQLPVLAFSYVERPANFYSFLRDLLQQVHA